MARIWKERRQSISSNRMGLPYQQSPDPKIIPNWIYFIRVCGFTFEFVSVDHIREALNFYSQKIHPSSRLPTKEWVEIEARKKPQGYKERIRKVIKYERFYLQRWYERLPQYLQENGKREKVVKALQRALERFPDK
jgi:hypothetical protein